MLPPKEILRHLLKEAGQSATQPRLRVFETLLGQEPLSMHEIVQRARGVDRASVYRTVTLFERLGIAQRISYGWKYKIELTDKFSDHHHHLTCVQCGKTIDIGEDDLEVLISRLAARYNFVPTTHQIEIQGVCATCDAAATQPAPGRP